MNPKVKAEIDNILDCFGGSDGGVSFANLKCLLSEMCEKSCEGDASADKVLEVLARFSRLVDVAQNSRCNPNYKSEG